MTHLSRLQTLFDLFNAQPSVDTAVETEVRVWEERTGLAVPKAVRDFYVLKGTVSLGEGNEPWVLSMDRLWAQYWVEPPPTLSMLLLDMEHAHASNRHEFISEEMLPLPTKNPLIWVEQDVMSIWRGFVELDGSDDPPVWVHCRASGKELSGWTPATPALWKTDANEFSSFMYMMAATSYVPDQVPWKYFGPEADDWRDEDDDDAYDRMSDLVKPNDGGLWLRARDERLCEDALSSLRNNYEERDRHLLHESVTTHEFVGEQTRILVTTDSVSDEGGSSAWWIHAYPKNKLLNVAKSIWNIGSLRQTLRADYDDARSVLAQLRG